MSSGEYVVNSANVWMFQVLKLHTKLGKPIPSADPVISAAKVAAKTAAASKTPVKAKPVAAPKINFVGKFTSVLQSMCICLEDQLWAQHGQAALI